MVVKLTGTWEAQNSAYLQVMEWSSSQDNVDEYLGGICAE